MRGPSLPPIPKPYPHCQSPPPRLKRFGRHNFPPPRLVWFRRQPIHCAPPPKTEPRRRPVVTRLRPCTPACARRGTYGRDVMPARQVRFGIPIGIPAPARTRHRLKGRCRPGGAHAPAAPAVGSPLGTAGTWRASIPLGGPTTAGCECAFRPIRKREATAPHIASHPPKSGAAPLPVVVTRLRPLRAGQRPKGNLRA